MLGKHESYVSVRVSLTAVKAILSSHGHIPPGSPMREVDVFKNFVLVQKSCLSSRASRRPL